MLLSVRVGVVAVRRHVSVSLGCHHKLSLSLARVLLVAVPNRTNRE
jgi:hypothetical protein